MNAVLWALSDSLLESKPAGIGRTMNTSSAFIQNWRQYLSGDGMDWLAQMNRFKADRATLKTYPGHDG